MKFSNIRHIYFDLDHTLWDFDKNSALTFEKVFHKEKIDVNLNCFLEAYIPINENYWKLYRDNQITKEALRTGRLKDCFDSMNVVMTYEVIEILSSRYIEFLPGFNNLIEDTQEVLEYLNSKYELHIITNGFEEIQHTKLINARISDYFNTITTSEEAGVKKPHPEIFHIAMQKSDALASQCLMIGDSFEADILGAQKVGMHSLYFDYYRKESNSQTPSIQKLKQLMDYL